MPNEFKLQTFKGKNISTGEEHEWDLDELLVKYVEGGETKWRRVGFVPHADGATLRLCVPMSPPTITEALAAVRAQRQEQGKGSVVDRVSELPKPEELRKAARAAKAGAA